MIFQDSHHKKGEKMVTKKSYIALLVCSFFCATYAQDKNDIFTTTKPITEKAALHTDSLEPKIDITNKNREEIAKTLNVILADLKILYVKAQNFHWNVVASNFAELHTFFGKIYDELSEKIDAVAERVRALGFRADGTMKEFLAKTRLKEEATVPAAKEMIRILLDDYEAIIRSLRFDVEKSADLGDMGTNTLLADMMLKMEKTAWMLRSFLQ